MLISNLLQINKHYNVSLRVKIQFLCIAIYGPSLNLFEIIFK